ncbi:hypothetical protein OH76DRAFT_815619 [Lentinus brumalis]|uniref:Uncharacterized protein n=1 Tax=Lentinus brumalis TaxID=2498619 RepID=A0A371D2K7_9APHY|nr:hypothetical protein OH76DRAFT_815619 [Polyporus brumalis]
MTPPRPTANTNDRPTWSQQHASALSPSDWQKSDYRSLSCPSRTSNVQRPTPNSRAKFAFARCLCFFVLTGAPSTIQHWYWYPKSALSLQGPAISGLTKTSLGLTLELGRPQTRAPRHGRSRWAGSFASRFPAHSRAWPSPDEDAHSHVRRQPPGDACLRAPSPCRRSEFGLANLCHAHLCATRHSRPFNNVSTLPDGLEAW